MEKSISSLPELKLYFFDLAATIKSDSDVYLNLFASMYGRFRSNEGTAITQLAEFIVLTNPDNEWGKPVLILDGEVWPLNQARMLQGYIYERVLNAMIVRVRSHFLIHAGAVIPPNGGGIILAADSGHGKTTLVLKLISRGYKFLSDEMAAISRANKQVYPFPRSLRLRPDTLELVGFSHATNKAVKWLDKFLLDIEHIQPHSMGQAVPIRYIIILKNPKGNATELAVGNSERELAILIERLDEDFLTKVNQIEGITEVKTDVDRGYPLLRIQTAHRPSVLARLESLCKEEQLVILDVIKRVQLQPTFEAPARLESISTSQATLELLKRFQGGDKSALLQDEFGGSSTQMFMELMSLIGQADCYYLWVGSLNQTVDLVSGLSS